MWVMLLNWVKPIWDKCWQWIVGAVSVLLIIAYFFNQGKSSGKATQLEKELKLEKKAEAKVIQDVQVIQETKNEVAARTDDQLLASADKWVRKP